MSQTKVFVVLALVVVVVGIGAGAYYLTTQSQQEMRVAVKGDRAEPGKPDIGGPFQLVDHRGRSVSDADFRGRHMLVFFGFTNCPDICPTTMLDLTEALDLLGGEARTIQPLFITVDPLRDTPDVIAEYLENFHSGFLGLTGTRQQIAAVERAYAVYARVGEGADYAVDHTAITYLMGPDGTFRTFISQGTKPEAIAAKIRKNL